MKQIIFELKKIEDVAVRIMSSDIGEKVMFGMIFSEKISQRVHSLFKQVPISFDYYDPDSSYEEDCRAFVYALSDHIQKLESEYEENKEAYDAFETLE